METNTTSQMTNLTKSPDITALLTHIPLIQGLAKSAQPHHPSHHMQQQPRTLNLHTNVNVDSQHIQHAAYGHKQELSHTHVRTANYHPQPTTKTLTPQTKPHKPHHGPRLQVITKTVSTIYTKFHSPPTACHINHPDSPPQPYANTPKSPKFQHPQTLQHHSANAILPLPYQIALILMKNHHNPTHNHNRRKIPHAPLYHSI